MTTKATDPDALLAPLRAEIDAADNEIIVLLARRMEIVARIAALKAEHGIPAVLPERIEAVLTRTAARAEELGADPQLIRTIYRSIIDAACAQEMNHFQ
jgi:chorismate mutase-like protein